jgi:hypothetical protein
MSDRANINVNVNVTGRADVKALAPDIKQVGVEAAAAGKIVHVLADEVKRLQDSGLNWNEAQIKIAMGAKEYSNELRKEAAEILSVMGLKDKYINSLAKGVDLHEKSAAAIKAESNALAARVKAGFSYVEQEDRLEEASQRRKLGWAQQAQNQRDSRTRGYFAFREQEDKLDAAAEKSKLDGIEKVRVAQARFDANRQRDTEKAAKSYETWWSKAIKAREAEEQKANKAAESGKMDPSDGVRTQNRFARSFLLPFLGQGGVNLPIPARFGISAASAAIGQPGGGYGQVGLLSEATSVVGKLGTAGVVGAASLLAIGAVSKEILDMTQNVAAGALELQNFSNRLGLSTVEAEKLQIASKIVGVSFSALETGARKISVALEDSTGLGKISAQALKGVGINIKELNGEAREVGPVLLEFLQRLAGTASETERIGIANRVLGRESRELIPLIRNYDELQKTVAKLGSELSEGANKQLAKAGQEFNTMGAAWDQLKKKLAEKVEPIIIPIVRQITEILTPSGSGKAQTTFSREDFFSDGPIGKGKKSTPLNADFFLGLEKDKRLDASASTYKSNRLQNDEEAISDKIQEIKKSRREIDEKLSNRIDDSVRTQLNADNTKASAEQKILENRLKSLRKAESTTSVIERELAQLEERAVAIEARAAGIDEKSATKGFQLDKLKRETKGKYTPAQFAKAGSFLDREIAAQAGMDDRAVQREQQMEDRRTSFAAQRNDLAIRSQQIAEKIKLNEIGAADAIQLKYAEAIDSLELIRREEREGILENMKGQQQKIALIKLAGQIERGEDAAKRERQKDLAALEIEKRQTEIEFQKQSRSMLRQFSVSETGKEFGAAERKEQASAGFGQGAFGSIRAQQQRLELARVLYTIEMDMAKDEVTANQRKLAELQAFINLTSKEREAQRDHEIAIIEYRQKGINTVRENTGRAFDEISSKGLSGGLASIFTSQLSGAARMVAQNVGQEAYTSGKGLGLSNMFGGQARQVTSGADGNPKLTTLGRLLAGTPFGVDVEKIALEHNTTSTQKNTTAVDRLTRAVSSGALTTPGYVGISSDMLAESVGGVSSVTDLAGRVSGIAGMVRNGSSYQAAPSSPFGRGVADFTSGVGSLISGNPYQTLMGGKMTVYDETGLPTTYNTSSSGAAKAGAAVGIAGAAWAGYQGISAGIKQGGARGYASAAESALATAAALDPEPISKAVLAASALAISMFKGLLGDPRKTREEEIDRFLRDNKVEVPQSEEVSQDINGRSISYDKSGKTRFGNTTIMVNVSAIDTQSFLDRSADIAGALTKELSVGNQPLTNQVQKAIFG